MMFWYKARRLGRRYGLTIFFVLLSFVGGFSLVYFGSQALSGFSVREPEPVAERNILGDPYDLDEYTAVDIQLFGDGVLFKHDCQGIWIAMPYEKTFSIRRGEVGTYDIRPTQHDLMYDILTSYAINMTYARLERMQHDFFYATVLLEKDDKILQLDTRPSDALALATRLKAPVYVSTALLRQQGRDICNDQPTRS